MSNIDICVKLLKRWVDGNGLVQKAIDSFWHTFSLYKEEDPDEYRSIFEGGDDSIELGDVSVSLMLRKNISNDYVRLIVAHNIYFREKCIGYYKLVLFLDGEYDDDVLDFK